MFPRSLPAAAFFLACLAAAIPPGLAFAQSPPAPPRPRIVREDAPPEPAPKPALPPAPVKKARPVAEAPAQKSAEEAAALAAEEAALKDKDTALRVQIFLDAANFGPGKIDGDIGEFTRKAARFYNETRNHAPDRWNLIFKESERQVTKLTTEYELKENDFRFLAPELPEAPSQQASFSYLGYRSIDEFIAERYHTSEGFLARLNPTVRISRLKAGSKVAVPNVAKPFVIEEVPYSKAYEAEGLLGERSVLLDTKARMASFYDEAGALFACFPITPGRDKFIKPGEFELKKMITTPEFRYDKSMLERGERSEDYCQLPPGPNSPVGIFWASTSRNGIGLHGTATPHAIGRGQSAGCVRFANWDAVRLPDLIRPGTKLLMR